MTTLCIAGRFNSTRLTPTQLLLSSEHAEGPLGMQSHTPCKGFDVFGAILVRRSVPTLVCFVVIGAKLSTAAPSETLRNIEKIMLLILVFIYLRRICSDDSLVAMLSRKPPIVEGCSPTICMWFCVYTSQPTKCYNSEHMFYLLLYFEVCCQCGCDAFFSPNLSSSVLNVCPASCCWLIVPQCCF